MADLIISVAVVIHFWPIPSYIIVNELELELQVADCCAALSRRWADFFLCFIASLHAMVTWCYVSFRAKFDVMISYLEKMHRQEWLESAAAVANSSTKIGSSIQSDAGGLDLCPEEPP